jgi:16S rRNA pseudouridine516 synthase
MVAQDKFARNKARKDLLSDEYITVFREGIYFAYENITTQSAALEILSAYTARLSLIEGKYHQVKRMFGYFQNEVLALHRATVGHLSLEGLEVGQSRQLTVQELGAMVKIS